MSQSDASENRNRSLLDPGQTGTVPAWARPKDPRDVGEVQAAPYVAPTEPLVQESPTQPLSHESPTEVMAHGAPSDVLIPAEQMQVRVPVMEEQLEIDVTPVVRDEVVLDRRVTEEEQTITVEVIREQLRVSRRPLAARALRADEGPAAFQERTFRVPVFGEHASARKQPFITGEVVVHRRRVPEQQIVTETLRREHVENEEDYTQERPVFHQDFVRRQEETGDLTRTFDEAEPNYRRGYAAARESRFAERDFNEVERDLRQEYEVTHPERTPNAMGWKHILDEVRAGWARARDRT